MFWKLGFMIEAEGFKHSFWPFSRYSVKSQSSSTLKQEMSSEGFRNSNWPGLLRQHHSKKRGSFSDSKRYTEGKLFQSPDAASRRKLILLHDLWLVKADSDSGGKRLGIGGYTLKENQSCIRCFSSAYISKRHDAITLETADGIKLMLHGFLNRARTLENGFSQQVCDDFVIGFPYYWEEFAIISVNEDSSPSKGVSSSVAYKTPAQDTQDSRMLSDKSPDAKSSSKKGTRVPKRRADSGGPLTRSRARLPYFTSKS